MIRTSSSFELGGEEDGEKYVGNRMQCTIPLAIIPTRTCPNILDSNDLHWVGCGILIIGIRLQDSNAHNALLVTAFNQWLWGVE